MTMRDNGERRGRGRAMPHCRGIVTSLTWASDSNEISDLGQILLKEKVQVTNITGTFTKAGGGPSDYNPLKETNELKGDDITDICDAHTTATARMIRPGGVAEVA